MIKLFGTSSSRWDGDPLVCRATLNPRLPSPLRDRHALVLHNGIASDGALPEGFGCYVTFVDAAPSLPLATTTRFLTLPPDLTYLTEGDILRIDPRAGRVRVLFRRNAPSNSFLLTERCNSNCVMCSQPPKDVDDSFLIDELHAVIPLIDPSTKDVGLTGGEPTLLGDRFISLVQAFKNYLPSTSLHVLSNGRRFQFLKFARTLASVAHPDIMIGIPLYSDIAWKHDFVVQAKGAYDETIRGILNLGRVGVPVEIRVVLHRYTVDRLAELARFIARNLTFVSHVALMGLEQMGYVKMNLEALWIDPADYQEQLCDAVAELEQHGLMVSVYNHQLCVLDSKLWSNAARSISDWKNDFLEECNTCNARSMCGGFFSSSTKKISRLIRPLALDEIPQDVKFRMLVESTR